MDIRNWLTSDLGVDIWNKKYRANNESFDEWLDRVSGGSEELKQAIVDKKFLFGGRILANRGLDKLGKRVTYSNCYVISAPEDNIESIFDTASKLARTFSYGGGCGTDLSKLCPANAKVNNSAENSTGAVSFMDLYSHITGLISQKGRRGALMLSMECSHPDLLEFIKIKTDLDRVTKANISVRFTDKFFQAVKGDKEWELRFERPETGEVISTTYPARDILRMFAETNWDYAEPGALFWDKVTNWSLLSEYDNFEFAGTNPCLTGDTLITTTDGEIPIKDLVGKTPHVYCMGEDGKLSIRQASKVWMTKKNASLVEVRTHKGNIRCTPDHRIFTTNRGWVEAQDLKSGDKIKGLNRSLRNEQYLRVGLSGEGYVSEHRLVAGYFEDIEGKDVHHIDGDTFNNVASNLEVLTHEEHSRLTNLGHEGYADRCSETGRFLPKEAKKPREARVHGKQVGTNWYVQEVVHLDITEDVYDMTVPGVHNFVANNMVVHNCGEQPLPAGGSCLLGSINLSEFVKNPFTEDAYFDFVGFNSIVELGVRELNKVLDEGLELHPLQEQRDSVRDWRQIGLGIMGLADMLIKLGIPYGSQASLTICDTIASNMINTAVMESAELAREFGSYPKYEFDKVQASPFYEEVLDSVPKACIASYGLRNSQILTVAPTGSLSTMLEISGGIEPIFDTQYMRRTQSLHGEDVFYPVYTKIISEVLGTDEVGEEMELPNYIITSKTLAPRARVDMQAVWQHHIDASISSTVNLVESATVEDIMDLYIYAWEKGLKGITVYRDNCKRGGVLLSSAPTEEEDTKELTRGEIEPPKDDLLGLKRRLHTGCGSLWCMAYFDKESGELKETFLSKGSTGGCNSFMNYTSRLISLCARGGISIDDIVDQSLSAPVCPSYAIRRVKEGDTSPGTNCPSAIGNALLDMQKEANSIVANKAPIVEEQVAEVSKMVAPTKDIDDIGVTTKCPECDKTLIHSGGCTSCMFCGWSKCN